MSIWIWALVLLIIGLLEYFIDQYQKITLARLKFWQAVLLQYINKLVEFAVNVYVFGTIIIFYDKLKSGIYDWSTLGPYLAYFHGCVLGTAIAIIIYRRLKSKKDKERRIRFLEKARLKKKQYSQQLPDVSMEIEESLLGDDLDNEDLKQTIVEEATERIVKKVTKSVRRALEEEDEPSEEIRDQTNSDRKVIEEKEHKQGSSSKIKEGPEKT